MKTYQVKKGALGILIAALFGLILMSCSSPVAQETDGLDTQSVVSRNFTSSWSNAYFRGTPNSWGTTAMELVGNNTWSVVADFNGQTNPRFKIDRHGDWGENYPTADYTVAPGIYQITFNDSTKAISVQTVDNDSWSSVYFRGTSNSWGTTAMTQVSDFVWEITQDFSGQTNPRFKVDRYGDWSENYPTGDYIIENPGLKTIQFNTSTKVFTVTDQQGPEPTVPNTLGALYTPAETVFRIWSPDHSNVAVFTNGQLYPMSLRSNFNGYTEVYEVVVPEDLKLQEYQFRINGIPVRDPYGKMVKPGENVNIVMDMDSIEPVGGWVGAPALDHRTDTQIYEVHIRDFTQHSTWNGSEANRGKFLGMVEEGTTYQGVATGLDHLKELGVTHIQILPFYDFATPHYNWGYDPMNWNVPEEQYSAVYAQNPYDYEGRVREVMTMINEFHRHGFRVIMDVVYNHTYGDEMFEDITTQYYTGNNDSGTGNGINTGVPMVSRLIQDSQEHWVTNYNVNGFRHDLMGIYHTEEVRKWGHYLDNETFPDRNLVIFGEPWNGYWGDPEEGQKVRYGSTILLSDVHIGVFNGGFREAIKGQSDEPAGAYMFNKFSHHKVDGGWSIFDGMRGSPHEWGGPHSGSTWGRNYAGQPAQSVNYISAHDNFGLWDRVYIELASNVVQNGSKQVMSFTPPTDLTYGKRIVNFGMGIIYTSQGISFTHAGDEFLRTKTMDANITDASAWRYGQHGGTHNTYNSPDSFNMIRWNWKVENQATFEYFRDLIEIRNNHPGLRMRTNQDIAQYLNVSRPAEFGGQVITGHITYPGDTHNLFIVYNSGGNHFVPLPPGNWSMIANAQGAVNQPGQSGWIVAEGTAVTIFSQPR